MPAKKKIVVAKDNRPTVAEILELYDDCTRRYAESGLFSQFEEDEQYYELDFRDKLLLPKEFAAEGVVLPTARDIVDTCVDHTDVFNPRVWVNKKGTSPKASDEANMLRKFGLGVLYRNNMEASIAPIRVGAKHFWMSGLTIFKDVWDADRWMDKPNRDENEDEAAYAERIDKWRATKDDSIPIVIKNINPRNIMLDPYYDGGMFVFEEREELCFNVKQTYDWWTNPLGKKITDRVVHISFWTKDWRCELYDKEPVLRLGNGVVKHSYGFIPYVAIDTGLGNMSADNDLKKRYVGVLRYIHDVLISESRDYSIGDVILKRTAFPWGVIKGPNASAVSEVFQKFGEYTDIGDAELIDMAPKVPPDALLSWLGVAADYLAAHAAPASVRGMGETGVRAAADRRLLIAEASTRYTYSNEAFRHGVAKVLSNCARIMKYVIPGNFSVWARTPNDEFDIEIDKKLMKEPFTFYVEFSPVSEEDEYRRHDDLERLYKSGIYTKKHARQQMSNVDPEALEIEEEVEKLNNDQNLQQITSQAAAAELTKALAPYMPPPAPPAQGMQGQEAGAEPGRRMAPPIPNRAQPGSAEELQNQMQNARSQTPMVPGQGQGGGGFRQ